MEERIVKWQEGMERHLSEGERLFNEALEIQKLLRGEMAALEKENEALRQGADPPPKESRLNVPYVSQWGSGADGRRGDCGPAALASVIHYLTGHRPTVDEVAVACGQAETGAGSHYTDAQQLIRGAAEYGVSLEVHGPCTQRAGKPKLTTGLMTEHLLRDGFPSIPLIDYRVLRDRTNPLEGVVHNQDQRFDRGHWVCFVGFRDASGVWIHDPDFWGNRASDGAFRWVPWAAWTAALASAAEGNSYGHQGLIVKGVQR